MLIANFKRGAKEKSETSPCIFVQLSLTDLIKRNARNFCHFLRVDEQQGFKWINNKYSFFPFFCPTDFHRFYQVRCSLRVSPRLSAQIETNVLDDAGDVIENKELTSATVIRGAGTSKIFQILYRNEEVVLRDTILFRVRLPGKRIPQNRARIVIVGNSEFMKTCCLLCFCPSALFSW